MTARVADPLKTQYEVLPYPSRDPADERNRLIMTELERLSGINHFIFGGFFDRYRPFRVLIAGGGTGDALICLAIQLRALGIPGEITYIDLSAASREIAQARASTYGFDNIHFETGSFLESGRLAPSSFDYINCSGVLHHLESPLDGLRTLTRLLHPRGGMGLMLYGKLGRTGIYPVQSMLRILAPNTETVPERIRIARKLVSSLPAQNWLNRNVSMYNPNSSDAEVFDMLLHSRDRAFGVEDIASLVAAASLRVLCFIPPAVYRPGAYLRDSELLQRLANLDSLSQAAFAEKLNGGLYRHEFYVVNADNPVSPPDFRDPDCIPMLDSFPQFPEPAGEPIEIALMEPYFQVKLMLPAVSAHILLLIDGNRSLREIRQRIDISEEKFDNTWSDLYRFMHGHGYLHLSHNPIPLLRLHSGHR